MQELRTSNDLLDEPLEMRRRMDRDGYLFFRDVVDLDDVARVREGVTAWCREKGLATSGDARPVWSGVAPDDLGEQPEDLHARGHWQWLAQRPAVQSIVAAVLGEPGLVLPITEYHFTWPGKALVAGIHQDGVYSAGMDFTVFWIPLMDIDSAVGGIALAPGEHTRGALHPVPGLPHPFVPPESIPESTWARADYRPGDILAIGRWTPHVGQTNSSDVLRLSIDFRASPASYPRPAIGEMIEATDDAVVVACDDGTTLTLALAGDTVVRVVGGWRTPPTARFYVGKSVIVTHHDGVARLIRQPHGNRSTVEIAPPSAAPVG